LVFDEILFIIVIEVVDGVIFDVLLGYVGFVIVLDVLGSVTLGLGDFDVLGVLPIWFVVGVFEDVLFLLEHHV